MFSILVCNLTNQHQIINPGIGILKTNYLDQTWTATPRGGILTYNAARAATSLETRANKDILPGLPTVIDHTSWTGKDALEYILATFHEATRYGTQVTITRNHLTHEQIKPDPAWIQEAATEPYRLNKYGKPDILKNLQFLTCWAHPCTPDWDEWELVLKNSYEAVAKYGKPVFADISTTYAATSKTMSGKLIDPERFSWIIERAYLNHYDGLIIRDGALTHPALECIVNTLNQVNEVA